MLAEIKRSDIPTEFWTDERCFILEVANDSGDEDVSIAKARVEPGITTTWHKLNKVSERYIIISGLGRVEIGSLDPVDVSDGDIVRIPAGSAQRIANIGSIDLVFYVICSPRFRISCYETLENNS